MLLQSYQSLNGFLCTFIDRSLVSHQYIIRNRYLLEKILNYEFQVRGTSALTGQMDNLLFVGKKTKLRKNQNEYFSLIDNEKTFTRLLFYGEERSLFLWNTATFLFIDVLVANYVLAAAITYILNGVSIHFKISYKI